MIQNFNPLPILESGLIDQDILKNPRIVILNGCECIAAILHEQPVLIHSDVDILRLLKLSGYEVS